MSNHRAVVCVASGPSRSAEQAALIAAARERDLCRVIVCNREWEWLPCADVLYAADTRFWRHYGPRINAEFRGECWTASEIAAREFGVQFIRCLGLAGLSRDPTLIHGGSNGGYQAINLARHFGACTIILCGYDLQRERGRKGGRAHHFGDHVPELRQADDPSKWAPLFRPLAADLEAECVRVVNCSGESALDCFERADLAETLAALAV